jgi:hypothetical protein
MIDNAIRKEVCNKLITAALEVVNSRLYPFIFHPGQMTSNLFQSDQIDLELFSLKEILTSAEMRLNSLNKSQIPEYFEEDLANSIVDSLAAINYLHHQRWDHNSVVATTFLRTHQICDLVLEAIQDGLPPRVEKGSEAAINEKQEYINKVRDFVGEAIAQKGGFAGQDGFIQDARDEVKKFLK